MNNPSGKPILLITDGHKSHETREVLALAHQHQIIFFSLLPHTTHKLQPLDVAVFGPLQTAWGCQCRESAIQGMPVSHAMFVEEYLAIWEKSMTMRVIQNAFKCCGIHPFDDTLFTDTDFGPSLVTSMDCSHMLSEYPAHSHLI